MNPVTQQIKEALLTLAILTGKDLSAKGILDAYIGALADLDQRAVLRAIEDWLKTGRGFPFPADIRAKVRPEIDGADDAQIVSNLIIGAISKYGYTNPDRAEEHVGPLGWKVVEIFGGWKHLCEFVTHDNEATVKAQLRELAKTVWKQAKRGEIDRKPALPAPGSEVRTLVNTTMKGIEQK